MIFFPFFRSSPSARAGNNENGWGMKETHTHIYILPVSIWQLIFSTATKQCKMYRCVCVSFDISDLFNIHCRLVMPVFPLIPYLIFCIFASSFSFVFLYFFGKQKNKRWIIKFTRAVATMTSSMSPWNQAISSHSFPLLNQLYYHCIIQFCYCDKTIEC